MYLNLDMEVLDQLNIPAFVVQSNKVVAATKAMNKVPWFTFVRDAAISVNVRRAEVREAALKGEEVILRTPQGESVWAIKPFKMMSGTLFVVKDLTAQSRDQEWTSLLIHHVVHEIRNSLNNIALATDQLEEPFRSKVEASISRLERLAEQLTTLSSLNRSGEARTDLRKLADTVRASLEVKVEVKPDAQGAVWQVPADLLLIVVKNLVENAKLYGKDPVISFDSDHISVSDTGPGLPARIVENMFKPFNTSRNIGLGLYLSKKICDILGLSLLYKPNHPTGAVFTISLPSASNMQVGGG